MALINFFVRVPCKVDISSIKAWDDPTKSLGFLETLDFISNRNRQPQSFCFSWFTWSRIGKSSIIAANNNYSTWQLNQTIWNKNTWRLNHIILYIHIYAHLKMGVIFSPILWLPKKKSEEKQTANIGQIQALQLPVAHIYIPYSPLKRRLPKNLQGVIHHHS